MRRLALLLALYTPAALYAQASCTVSSGSSTLVDFGVYSPLQGNQDGIGILSLTCVPDPLLGLAVSYDVEIGPGTGNGGSFNPRRLLGAGSLDYNLYVDPARTLIWGDGTSSTQSLSGNCVGVCALNVYGRIPGGQAIPAGQYSDDVVITVEFN